MRTWLLVLLVMLTCLGCEENIEFNAPALQANKDGEFWKSISQGVSESSNVLTISARLNGEVITLEVPSNGNDTLFELGAGKTPKATYLDANNVMYTTLFSAVNDTLTTNIDESVIFHSEGQIEIDDINNTEGFVSGKFWFTAYDSLGLNKVNFNNGVFYQVPFSTE
ncbi:hypothetical protein BN863_31710 [Formosa agariphila KMM 3901]|uniref:Uncharacterized protein n=1 Tax=Formosa agariphila (strain DSM 15362 / KCTC 12365 / LMG 23005 / KMM 3901 / M-2Alg 35-1) TaxID=1347342 RepID=T2KQU8_FORAG|nr:DUF6252 family protein [Formosa agariphila]CDF80883.1 hypothetical protein BN863_31710 [Formosa agariphila KMM 3901]